MKLEESVIQKILVIKLRAIGDVLLSTVVLENLRRSFPNARIDFLTEKPSREVVEGNPHVDSVVIFDSKHDSGARLIFSMRHRNYDLVIDLFGNPRSALITYFSGARYRVGYRFSWRQHCYTTIVEPRGGDVHNAEFNLDALRALEIPLPVKNVAFPLDDGAEQFAREFFDEAGLNHKFVVAINPGGGWYTKRWRPARFAQLADRLVDECHAQVLVLWGPGEEKDATLIQSLMRCRSLLIPRTNLKQLAALLQQCDVLVTNDSGPMHIAAAVKLPVVGIFGPTNPELQGPYEVDHEIVQHRELLCLGCNYTACPIGNPCMEELPVEEVFSAVQALMQRTRQTANQRS